MRIQSKVIIICCLIVLIITSLLAASCGNKRSTRPSTRMALGAATTTTVAPVVRTLTPLPARPLSPRLRAVRERVALSTSNLRELQWMDEVGVTELSGWEYGRRTSEMAHVLGGEELAALGKLAAAGGMLPEGIDLATLAAAFTALSAGATYSPLDKQILLVDKHTDDSTLTHEFVHALQDQHFDLLKLLMVRPYNFDRTEALFAVIEGDAMNVQRRAEEGDRYARRSIEEIARQERERFGEYRQEMDALFPPLLTETFIFRYRDGARFVETIRRRAGQAGVDELYIRPPASSEQILHPEKYLQREAPRDVSVDEAAFAGRGWRAVASTSLGEIGVRGLLMEGVSDKDAERAAAGWGGDRAHLLERTGNPSLFVWKTVWDKPADAEEFFRAYNALRQRRGAQRDSEFTSGDKAQTIFWRADGRLTLVQREGDAVIVMRGAEQDVYSMRELLHR